MAGPDGLWQGRLVHPGTGGPGREPLVLRSAASLPGQRRPAAPGVSARRCRRSHLRWAGLCVLLPGAAGRPTARLVLRSIRHVRRGSPIDISDPTSPERVERQLRESGRYLDFTWALVIIPLPDGRSRLLVRTRADCAPRSVRWLSTPFGLFDATYGRAMLRAIARRAELHVAAVASGQGRPEATADGTEREQGDGGQPVRTPATPARVQFRMHPAPPMSRPHSRRP